MNKPQNIIVHHSITPRDLSVAKTEGSINTTHKNRGFPISKSGWYVGYHLMIFGNGQVKRYREDNEAGAHCKEGMMNFKSIGICLIGDFDNELPSEAQINTLRTLLQELTAKYGIPVDRIVPHRRYALNPATGKPYKSCFGNKLPDNWAQTILNNGDDMWKKEDVIRAFWKILVLFGHPPINATDIAIHMKAQTPDEFVSGLVSYFQDWLAKNGSVSAIKDRIINFIKTL